jgi:hypothetical protein
MGIFVIDKKIKDKLKQRKPFVLLQIMHLNHHKALKKDLDYETKYNLHHNIFHDEYQINVKNVQHML